MNDWKKKFEKMCKKPMFYRLEEDIFSNKLKIPVPCSMKEWSEQFRSDERQIALDIFGKVKVSTVFLGFDYGYWGAPLLFETMIFDDECGDLDGYQVRYETYGEALEGHEKACRKVRDGEKD